MKENNQNIEKLLLLFTVVTNERANLFLDFLETNGVNAQFVLHGEGMHPKKYIDILNYTHKCMIISFIGEDKASTIIRKLEDKFEQVKYCYGACWTIPLKSIIGVESYKFLVDYREQGGIK